MSHRVPTFLWQSLRSVRLAVHSQISQQTAPQGLADSSCWHQFEGSLASCHSGASRAGAWYCSTTRSGDTNSLSINVNNALVLRLRSRKNRSQLVWGGMRPQKWHQTRHEQETQVGTLDFNYMPYIPYILSGRLTNWAKVESGTNYISATHAFVRATLKLGLRAPLVARNKLGIRILYSLYKGLVRIVSSLTVCPCCIVKWRSILCVFEVSVKWIKFWTTCRFILKQLGCVFLVSFTYRNLQLKI